MVDRLCDCGDGDWTATVGRAADAAERDDGISVRKRVPEPDAAPNPEAVCRCFAFEPRERPTAAELAQQMEPAHAPARQEFAEQLQVELARERERASNAEQLLVTVQLGPGADGDAGSGN